jgi:cell wall-associated NlpC family hydrolase
MALAVVTPALEPVEATAAVQAAPVRTEPVRKMEPARVGTLALNPDSTLSARAMAAQRASRAAIRRAAGVRPVVTSASRRPTSITRTEGSTANRRTQSVRSAAPSEARTSTTHRSVRVRRARSIQHTVVRSRRVTRHTVAPRTQQVVRLGNMTAVIAYAKAHVGERYVSGGEGRNGFDCSGLTKRAYAQAGISLPHSSRAQAARARRISRSQARAGDLVVGEGHVGIYMGRGMMIDAGNSRTGVVYRKLYSGLAVERL